MRRTWTTTPRTTTTVGLWISRLIWISLWACGIENVAAGSVPNAISVAPSQFWEGNDGPWSTFPIRVGSPAQNVRVLISTGATATWVIATEGCSGTGFPSNCSDVRGSLFNISSSTSWDDNGPWQLGVEQNMGDNYAADQGEFGWETVALGMLGSGLPELNHTVVAGLQTTDYYIGQLGLNPWPTNFSDFNHPQPSYLSLLYENLHIPSLTYSYTAGAAYRFNKVLGSLVLGGYDESLFIPNSVSFPFYFDQSREFTVGLKGIKGSNGRSLLPTPVLSLVDSTMAQIWLPVDACNVFESVFGLVYDDQTELYLVNETQHISLLKQNISMTFTLAPTLDSTNEVNIVFPYAAFDLEVAWPIVNSTTRYFPLKRAANDTQYTLGRTFLQEAYLTVDYPRANFSISQRAWSLTAASNIIDILPANTSITITNGTSGSGSSTGTGTGSGNGTGTDKSTPAKKIATGAIVGIVIGAVLLLAGAGFAIRWFLLRRARKHKEKHSAELAADIETSDATKNAERDNMLPPDPYSSPLGQKVELDTPGAKAPELYGNYFGGHEMSGEERMAELSARPDGGDHEGIFELEAPHGNHELHSEESPAPSYSEAGGSRRGHNPLSSRYHDQDQLRPEERYSDNAPSAPSSDRERRGWSILPSQRHDISPASASVSASPAPSSDVFPTSHGRGHNHRSAQTQATSPSSEKGGPASPGSENADSPSTAASSAGRGRGGDSPSTVSPFSPQPRKKKGLPRPFSWQRQD